MLSVPNQASTRSDCVPTRRARETAGSPISIDSRVLVSTKGWRDSVRDSEEQEQDHFLPHLHPEEEEEEEEEEAPLCRPLLRQGAEEGCPPLPRSAGRCPLPQRQQAAVYLLPRQVVEVDCHRPLQAEQEARCHHHLQPEVL